MLVSINKNNMNSIFEPPYDYTDTWKEMARIWSGRFAVFHEGKRWLSGRSPLLTREITTLDQNEFEKYLHSMAVPLDRPHLDEILRNGGVFTMALSQRAARIFNTESASVVHVRSDNNALYVINPGKDRPSVPENLLQILDHALITHKMESITSLALEMLSELSWLPSSVWVYPGSSGIKYKERVDSREIVYQSSLFGVWKRKILPTPRGGMRPKTQHPFVDDLGFLWVPIFLYRVVPLIWITMSLTQAADRKISEATGRRIFHDLTKIVNQKAHSLKFSPLSFMSYFSQGAYDWVALKDVLHFRNGEGIDKIPVFIVRDTTIDEISRYIRANDLIFRTRHEGEYLVAPYQISLEQTESLIFPRLVEHRIHALPPFCAGDITSVPA